MAIKLQELTLRQLIELFEADPFAGPDIAKEMTRRHDYAAEFAAIPKNKIGGPITVKRPAPFSGKPEIVDYPYETLRLACGCYETQTFPGGGAIYVCEVHQAGKYGEDIFDAISDAREACRKAGVILFRSIDRLPDGSWEYPEAHR